MSGNRKPHQGLVSRGMNLKSSNLISFLFHLNCKISNKQK